MKNQIALIIFVCFFSFAALGQIPRKNIESIREICKATNAQIAEMSQHPDLSSVFATELVVNKHLAPYPAVGIYQRTVTFFYTYGDREKNPYPDRLMKVNAEYSRSARTERAEFYFDNSGALIFVFFTNEDSAVKESRLYFAGARMIKMTDDGKDIGLKKPRAVEAGALSKKEAARLTGIFKSAITDYD